MWYKLWLHAGKTHTCGVSELHNRLTKHKALFDTF
jgi:hypothetical protein